MGKKYFCGWTNIKWLIKELINLYSNEDSYFSKKRIESGIAFLVGQWGMIYYIYNNINKLTSSDIALWAGIEFALAGYIINQIQKEKKSEDPTEKN
jgi:hypothetical protein